MDVKEQRRAHTHPEVVQGVSSGDPIFQAFDAARRQMTIGPSVTRQKRDELMFRAGFSAGKAHQVIEAKLELERQCTESPEH